MSQGCHQSATEQRLKMTEMYSQGSGNKRAKIKVLAVYIPSRGSEGDVSHASLVSAAAGPPRHSWVAATPGSDFVFPWPSLWLEPSSHKDTSHWI